MKKSLNTQKHLTLNERRYILESVKHECTLTSIADCLGKDKSTIGKEIKLHRILTKKCQMPLECTNYKRCTHNRCCSINCLDYVPFKCSRRDRSPGVCNGCSISNSCHYCHYMYDPENAQNNYEKILRESREGFNTTSKEVEVIAKAIGPLLKNGQSIYMALQSHPEIHLSEKTIYNYIEGGLLKPYGINMFSLRQKLSRKLPKSRKNLFKERKDFKYLELRKYEDYLAFMDEHPNANIVEMDTVYNDVSNGPFIQTFKFLKYGFLFAILQQQRTSEAMYEGGKSLRKDSWIQIILRSGTSYINRQRYRVRYVK